MSTSYGIIRRPPLVIPGNHAGQVGATGFTPTAIPGLLVWHKADAVSGSNGDPISQLLDFSGHSNHTRVSTGTVRPTLVTAGQNGLNVLACDASLGQGYNHPDIFGALTSGSVFIVFKTNADPPPTTTKSGLWQMTLDGNIDHWPWTDGNVYSGWGSNVRKTVGVLGTNLASAYKIIQVWSAPNDWGVAVNNVSVFTTGTNTVAFPTDSSGGGQWMLTEPTFGPALDGRWAELMIWDNKISSANATLVFNYLKAKWGL